jgi:Protein of unknown function (DUF2782)
MKRLLIGAITLALASAAIAQTDTQGKSDKFPVQAPPDMDSAGVKQAIPPNPNVPSIPLANSDAEAKAAAEAEVRASGEREKALMSPSLAPTSAPLNSPGLPPDVQKAAEMTELPVVTVRQEGNETIKEYRKHGVLYFVSVNSETGPTKYYVDNPNDMPPDIRQLSAPSGVVQPVYFKLLEWK